MTRYKTTSNLQRPIKDLKNGTKVLVVPFPKDRGADPIMTSEMEDYLGKFTHIKEVLLEGRYRLEIDNGKHVWAGRWLKDSSASYFWKSQENSTKEGETLCTQYLWK